MPAPADRNDVKNTPTATEDSRERGLVKGSRDKADPASYADLGASEELDPDGAGDIADEGRGHRG